LEALNYELFQAGAVGIPSTISLVPLAMKGINNILEGNGRKNNE
jgi:hypothetical protein